MNETRRKAIESAQSRASYLAGIIRTEVLHTKPRKRVSEIGEAIGFHTKPNETAASTPIGTFIWRKADAPPKPLLEKWRQHQQEIDQLLQQQARLASFSVIPANRTIGNQRLVENGEYLERAGMLDEEEISFLRQLQAFWRDNPQAKSGIVREIGIVAL